MAETYFEGTRWLMLRAREQKFSHFDHDDADGVAVYKVVNPEYMEWLAADNAALRKRVEELANLCAEAEGVLDAQTFKVVKETWEGWERWKMADMNVSNDIKATLATEEDLSKLTTQHKPTEEAMNEA